jgi:hypothetical protein
MNHIQKIERTLGENESIEDTVREEMIAYLEQLSIDGHQQSDDDWFKWTWKDTLQAVVSDAFSLGRIIAIAATEILPEPAKAQKERRLQKINYLRKKLQDSLLNTH